MGTGRRLLVLACWSPFLLWFLSGTVTVVDLSADRPEVHVLMVEPEEAVELPPRASAKREAGTSGKGYVEIVGWEVTHPHYGTIVAGEGAYPFEIQAAGEYSLWVRARWGGVCSNSITLAIRSEGTAGDVARFLVGNDPIFEEWHWVRSFARRFEAGRYEVLLGTRESSAMIDCVLLTDDPAATPGSLSAREGSGSGPDLAEYFFDNFATDDSPSPSRWTGEGWRAMRDGALRVVAPAAARDACLEAAAPPMEHGRIEGALSVPAAAEAGYFFGRRRPSEEFFALCLAEGVAGEGARIRLLHVTGEQPTVLGHAPVPSRPAAWRSLGIWFLGNAFHVYLDRSLVLEGRLRGDAGGNVGMIVRRHGLDGSARPVLFGDVRAHPFHRERRPTTGATQPGGDPGGIPPESDSGALSFPVDLSRTPCEVEIEDLASTTILLRFSELPDGRVVATWQGARKEFEVAGSAAQGTRGEIIVHVLYLGRDFSIYAGRSPLLSGIRSRAGEPRIAARSAQCIPWISRTDVRLLARLEWFFSPSESWPAGSPPLFMAGSRSLRIPIDLAARASGDPIVVTLRTRDMSVDTRMSIAPGGDMLVHRGEQLVDSIPLAGTSDPLFMTLLQVGPRFSASLEGPSKTLWQFHEWHPDSIDRTVCWTRGSSGEPSIGGANYRWDVLHAFNREMWPATSMALLAPLSGDWSVTAEGDYGGSLRGRTDPAGRARVRVGSRLESADLLCDLMLIATAMGEGTSISFALSDESGGAESVEFARSAEGIHCSLDRDGTRVTEFLESSRLLGRSTLLGIARSARSLAAHVNHHRIAELSAPTTMVPSDVDLGVSAAPGTPVSIEWIGLQTTPHVPSLETEKWRAFVALLDDSLAGSP